MVIVRPAGSRDVDAARDVLRAAYDEYATAFPSASWAQYLVEITDLEGRASASELLVAELEGRVAGCVSYYPPGSGSRYEPHSFARGWPDGWSAFRLLAVDPTARGRGIGRALTEACIARAREDGAPVLGLHTTAPMAVARGLYERMGFVRAPEHDFRPGSDVVVEAYRLDLSGAGLTS